MGRYPKGTNPEDIEKRRRIPRTFSIPTYISEELDNCKNPSALMTTLLEENMQRIGNLTLDEAVKAREDVLKEEIRKIAKEVMEETFKPKFEEIVQDTLGAYGYRVKTGDEI